MELISRDKAVSILQDMYDRADSLHESTDGDDWAWEEMKALQFAIDSIEERKEGEWLDNGDRYYRCSLCGMKDTDNWKFCRGCGARMKGE